MLWVKYGLLLKLKLEVIFCSIIILVFVFFILLLYNLLRILNCVKDRRNRVLLDINEKLI